MDIQDNKTLFHKNIKRFALKATAAAIVAFHAETATAVTCPAYISDATLAMSGCDFDSGSSVTVENGGVVAFIDMTGYTPTPPSSIAINAGGTISNSMSPGSGTSTGVGINIKSSSLSNGLSNSGTIISSLNFGVNIKSSSISNGISNSGTIISTNSTGISIISSSLSNGFSNSGTISTYSYGLKITHSPITGGISNSGTISSINQTGILITATSTVSGGISNSGTIEVGSNSNVDGIVIDAHSKIEGDVINSGRITVNDGADILLRAASTITASTITGSITNSGTITSTFGSGIAVNVSKIQDGISNTGVISAGSVGVTVNHESTVQEDISNTGKISSAQKGLSIFSAATIFGSITNSGTISGGQSGIRIASTASVVSGISNTGTISGGQTGILITANSTVGAISNRGTIQGDSNAINISINSNVSKIDILGQSAHIIGTVEAPNTNVNITDGAIFTSEGAYHVNLFKIASNAVFNMANTITAQLVKNSGKLSVSGAIRTIDGDYIQQTGGVLQTDVSSVSDFGQLLVTGNVDLSQSGDIDVQVAQNVVLHNGDILSNVISGSSLNTPANGFNISDNSYIWTFVPTLNTNNNGVNLTATINPDAYNVCQGTYCQGAATAIIGQVAAGNPNFSPYSTLPTANALRDAASQATPELTNENIQVVQLITRSVLDIVPMWNTLHGKSSGDAMLYQPGKIWVKPYGASMTQNKRSTVQGFNAQAYGAVIGKDIQLPNDWLFGGGFAAGGDNMHGKSVLSTQSINSQAYQGMVYGAKKLPNQTYFAGQGLVGYEINDTNRSIPLYASTAKGSFNSWFTNIRAEAGWSTDALSPNFIFTPEVDASYLYINQNRYRESGSLMDLLVASNHNASLVLGAYANGAYHLTSVHHQHDLTLTGYAGLAGDVMNNQPQVLSTFVASSSTFSTFGVQFNGVVFRGGAGLTLTNPTSPLLIELNYDLQVGNNAYSSIGAATIKYKI